MILISPCKGKGARRTVDLWNRALLLDSFIPQPKMGRYALVPALFGLAQRERLSTRPGEMATIKKGRCPGLSTALILALKGRVGPRG
jgi:hypothetical protein